jgi:hypothetical protein
MRDWQRDETGVTIRHREGVEEEDGRDVEQERRKISDADHRSAWREGEDG